MQLDLVVSYLCGLVEGGGGVRDGVSWWLQSSDKNLAPALFVR